MDKSNVLDTLAEQLAEKVAQMRTWEAPEPISSDEWLTARSAPDCIVADYLFADVGVFVAPGGTGKTTLILYEAICIALGLPLYGLEVKKSGPVLILTAEDSREMLVARMRAIAAAMNLDDRQRRTVCDRVRISDVSGQSFKLTYVDHDVVRPDPAIQEIIAGCKSFNPVLIVIDPAVSFGVGESRVNDAEQGLIEAARRLRRALNCCVRYVHHSGKQNARDKAVDQYAGRGGSAFADGARMVTVLQSMTPGDWQKATGTELRPGQTGLILARPKMSYAPPAGDILILREGYQFATVEAVKANSGEELEARGQRLLDILFTELSKGHYPTQNSLEAVDTGLTRAELRKVIAWLRATGRIDQRDKPGTVRCGSRTYLHPFGAPNANGAACEESPSGRANEKDVLGTPPPIRKSSAAQRGAHSDSPFHYGAPNQDGAATAHPAQRDEESTVPCWAESQDWEAL